ncbi:MAG TPA: hypothetical protein VGN37_16985 [Actinocatenispora sp.]
MEFRTYDEKRSLRRPTIDDDLADGAELSGEIEVTGARVEGGSYAGAEGDGEIERSVLSRVDLAETRLAPLTLTDVTLTGADVSNAQWSNLVARRTELVSCRATGWGVWIALAADLYLGDVRLDYAHLHIERAKGLVVFERCTVDQARISGDLSRVLFVDCDLAGVEFRATKSAGCDLRTSRLAGVRGLATMRGARVTGPQTVTVAAQLATELGLAVE